MRSHPSAPLSFPEYDRTHHTQRRRLFDRENPKRSERIEKMRTEKCFPLGERGIKLRDLPASSRVPEIIQQHSWEGFIQTRQEYCIDMVVLFYACMIPAVYHDRWVVRMYDKEVRISPEDIDAYLRTPRRAELTATYGLTPHPAFQEQLSPDIAASLRRSGYNGWDNSHRSILKAELHYDLAFLMLFIKASLKPSTHYTTADSQVAEVLYSLQNNLPMDVGHIIWMEILDAGMTLDGVLPFPCLITHFCREAGIRIGDLTRPMKDFSKTQYKHQVTAAAKLEAKRREDPAYVHIQQLAEPAHESSESASDSDPDFIPEVPAATAYAHHDDTPIYMRQWIDHMNMQMGGMNSNINVGFQGVNQRLDGYGTRLDDITGHLTHAGIMPPQQGGVPPQQPPQDRRRVRGRRGGNAPSSSRR